MTKKIMAAVFGYGHLLDEDKKSFLDKVVKAIISGEINAVIASGGCTSRKNNPGVSEVAVIYAYLNRELKEKGYRLVPKFWTGECFSPDDLERIEMIYRIFPKKEKENSQEIDFYFEDCARTTRENVVFMKNLLEKYNAWKGYELRVYCNRTHWVKIAALTFCVWRYVPKAVLNPNGHFKDYLKQLIVTVPTVVALKSKTLSRWENNRREKQMDKN